MSEQKDKSEQKDSNSTPDKSTQDESSASEQKPEQESSLSQAMLDAIHGKQTPEEKKEQYDRSLGNWWGEYAARKNDEEEEHVADSLLYDERCHLPRSAPRPEVVESNSGAQKAASSK